MVLLIQWCEKPHVERGVYTAEIEWHLHQPTPAYFDKSGRLYLGDMKAIGNHGDGHYGWHMSTPRDAARLRRERVVPYVFSHHTA